MRFPDVCVSLTILIGTASEIGMRCKIHYVANRLDIAPSYENVIEIKTCIINEYKRTGRTVMTNVQQQNIALFAVDILNISNHNEMLFNGKSFFGIHLIAIKAVFP